MIKYWTVKPEYYYIINDAIGSTFSQVQLKSMVNQHKNGIYIYTEKHAIHFYNDLDRFTYVRNKYDWDFQYEISLKTIRKIKLEKIQNENNLSIK